VPLASATFSSVMSPPYAASAQAVKFSSWSRPSAPAAQRHGSHLEDKLAIPLKDLEFRLLGQTSRAKPRP